ncbi:membrane protein insertase YidC [Ruminococcaceae bacterium OttesenSCG-928-L11]|nr:membrane protein insertase YidC [Ruminococcaceae bacterium OttesenSCG-928-L11]
MIIDFFYTILGTPLGWLMYLCYTITKSYGVAIVLLTLIFKLLLFPISILTQKNSIRMAIVQQKLDKIKVYHAGDKERISDEEMKLYKAEKYNPAIGCLPTILQLCLVIGLINVIYNPLKYLLRIDSATIDLLVVQASQILSVSELGSSAQLEVIRLMKDISYTQVFETLPGIGLDVFHAVTNFETGFLGFDLCTVPSLNYGFIIPIISGLSCLIMCVVQNNLNILQRTQKGTVKWGMTVFFVVFSTYFPFVVPIGVGLYWILNNLLSIVVMLVVNAVMNPNQYVEISIPLPRKSKEELEEEKQLQKQNQMRERADSKRFFAKENDNKQLVFYSAKSGFYKYFSSVIDYILAQSDIVIHYVTSDPDDAIFKKDNPQIIPYYIGEKALISFMMKIEADMVVMTMPDLQKYHIKRSYIKKDIEYIYMFHTVASMHMTLREGAVDHYDTIFCVGAHQVREIRKTEEVYELPEKKLIECGYGLIDDLMDAYAQMPPKESKLPQILIAPSWQADNILESCIDELLECVVGKGYRVIVRPHPEFIKRFKPCIDAINERWGQKQDENFIIELNFSSNETIYQSDILVTDWSNIAFEFSYCTKKPTIFINTPMKVMNPEYEVLDIVPLDITLRDEIGVSVDLADVGKFGDVVREASESSDAYRNKIDAVIDAYLFNPGHSGEVGGSYIIEALREKALLRTEDEDE